MRVYVGGGRVFVFPSGLFLFEGSVRRILPVFLIFFWIFQNNNQLFFYSINSVIFVSVSGFRIGHHWFRIKMGTPVKIRDYPRSCKFYSKVVHSEATAGMSGGKAYNRNKSEDLPEYFCLIRSFRVKGDRINELVNCTWCVQGSGHLHAIYLICEFP